MLVQAILIGLIAMFVTFEWMFGTNLGSRPIITGMLVGLVMGDLKTGIILGATLEMVFIGSITLGAAVPPDVITGGVLGAAFAISTGKGADVALALAFPIATLYGKETDGACWRKKFDGFWNGKKQCEDLCAIQ